MKRSIILLALALFVATNALADELSIGLVSFDAFIPQGTGPGVNAFDIFNLTGPTFGPFAGTPYAADSLIFSSAALTVHFQDGSSKVINLGNINPGELLDLSGNPLVQFPSTDNFTSALFTATLSPRVFMLSDGSTFLALPTISADLLPSSGSLLAAGTDFVIVNAEPAAVTSEPGTWVLLVTGSLLAGLFSIVARRPVRPSCR